MRRVGETLSWLVLVDLAAAVVLVAVTGVAQAEPGDEVQPAITVGSVDLGKVGPYRIGLVMPTNRVAIFYAFRFKVKRGKGLLASSAYAYAVHSRRPLARGAIQARFGSLGIFSLRFQPNGRVRKDRGQGGCIGRPSITEYGRFVGHARFDGGGDHLHFSLAGGEGSISRVPRLRCERGEALDSPRGSLRAYVAPGSFFATQGDIALLYATSKEHGRYIGITAGHKEESPPGAEVRIGILESKREMAIGRYVVAEGPPGTLLTSLPGVHPAAATLAPPAPFFGEAIYEEKAADSPEWAGNLGVNLPGLKLPLTGSSFHTRLCVISPLKTREGCDFFKAKPPVDERLPRPGAMPR